MKLLSILIFLLSFDAAAIQTQLNYEDFKCELVPGTIKDGVQQPDSYQVVRSNSKNRELRGLPFPTKEECLDSLKLAEIEKSPSVCAPAADGRTRQYYDLRDGKRSGPVFLSCRKPAKATLDNRVEEANSKTVRETESN